MDRKYDPTYEKETGARTLGILLIIFSLLYYGFAKGILSPFFFDNKLSYIEFLFFSNIGFLIVRIIIVIYVVLIAKAQNRFQFGWGLLSWLFPFITLIIIGSLNKLADEETKNNQSPTKNDTQIKELKNKLEELKKLYDDGILTIKEYKQKEKEINEDIIKIENNIKEEDERKKQSIIDKEVDEKALPFIRQIIDAKNNGLMTEEEFNNKTEEIRKKIRKEIEGRPTKDNVPKEEWEKLTPFQQNRVETLLEKIDVGEVIVKGPNKIRKYSKIQWEDIVKKGENKIFTIIIKYEINAA